MRFFVCGLAFAPQMARDTVSPSGLAERSVILIFNGHGLGTQVSKCLSSFPELWALPSPN